MNSFNTPNFTNLLLQPLSSRLPLRPPSSTPTLPLPLLEDLLSNNLNLSDTDSDTPSSPSSQLAKQESKLEKQIIRTILAKKYDDLKPNSAQAVTIGEHPICVGFHEDTGSDYRVWEWHGHIMLFDEEDGYTPEYIYGNYFEWLTEKDQVAGKKEEKNVNVVVNDEEEEEEEGEGEEEEEGEDKGRNAGLKDLIESGDSNGGRILHRNINAGSPRLFDEEDGYTPEYIYGNYFEWLTEKDSVAGKKEDKIVNVVNDEEEGEDKGRNAGLKDLIESGDSNGGRILHRNINAGSPRF